MSRTFEFALDEFNNPNQAMKPFNPPLDNSLVMFGRPCTSLHVNTYAVAEGEKPFEIDIALVDDLKPDGVNRNH